MKGESSFMLEKIQSIARKAGEMILNAHNAPSHQKEGHFNFVTDTDVAVQEYLKAALLALLPGARFFAEEQENESLTDAPTFVVDPIDGTINFMRQRNASAVSIALLEKKQPILGVIYQPYTDEMFTAALGKGAFLNGHSIHVSSVPFENAVVELGSSPYDAELARRTMEAATQFLLQAGDIRRSGSAAVDLGDIACGRGDIMFELKLRPWDVAAGSLLVKEAGGCFHSLGHDQPYYDGPCGIMACNPLCEKDALRILKEAGAC